MTQHQRSHRLITEALEKAAAASGGEDAHPAVLAFFKHLDNSFIGERGLEREIGYLRRMVEGAR